jgi:hypothetical protein
MAFKRNDRVGHLQRDPCRDTEFPSGCQQKVTPPEIRESLSAVVAVVNGKHTVTAADVDSLFSCRRSKRGRAIEVLRASGLGLGHEGGAQ